MLIFRHQLMPCMSSGIQSARCMCWSLFPQGLICRLAKARCNRYVGRSVTGLGHPEAGRHFGPCSEGCDQFRQDCGPFLCPNFVFGSRMYHRVEAMACLKVLRHWLTEQQQHTPCYQGHVHRKGWESLWLPRSAGRRSGPRRVPKGSRQLPVSAARTAQSVHLGDGWKRDVATAVRALSYSHSALPVARHEDRPRDCSRVDPLRTSRRLCAVLTAGQSATSIAFSRPAFSCCPHRVHHLPPTCTKLP